MNVRTAKKPKPRVDTRYLSTLGIQSYGEDNLYPQNLSTICAASGTAVTCLSRYEKFVEGYGFGDLISDYTINRRGMTLDDILHDVSGDVARFGGFALHVNYNLLGEIAEINPMPFEMCRLEEADDVGNVAYIVTHPDWTGRTTRNGKRLSVNDTTIKRFHIFDPRPNVVLQQIANVGGIDNYHGQIAWFSMDGRFTYPTPIYDAAITDISTDEGLGNIKYRNARNSFLVSCMLITRKNAPRLTADGREVNDPMISDDDLRAFQGDENVGKIMAVELEDMETKPEIVEFPTKNFDKDFSVSETSVIERIYAQFHQELFYSIRIGKLGFSGAVMEDAFAYYAGEVTTEQRFISRGISRIMASWHDVTMRNQNYDIQPMKYASAERNTI